MNGLEDQADNTKARELFWKPLSWLGTIRPTVIDCGLVLLREVKLALFREASAAVVLMQDLEGRPILGELLRDTALGRDDGLREMLGLLVLRGGRRRGGHLTPLECQMKTVELR
jgi:hypothetical protein